MEYAIIKVIIKNLKITNCTGGDGVEMKEYNLTDLQKKYETLQPSYKSLKNIKTNRNIFYINQIDN